MSDVFNQILVKILKYFYNSGFFLLNNIGTFFE